MENNAVLQMRNIHKSFPGVKALSGVDFTLRKGEIHALMGENGAGKSTLIKVLTGVYTKDEGHIYLDGHEKEVQIRSPQEAQKLGISPVYQEITLCPNLSVAENMYIGRTPGAVQNWRKMNKAADKLNRQKNQHCPKEVGAGRVAFVHRPNNINNQSHNRNGGEDEPEYIGPNGGNLVLIHGRRIRHTAVGRHIARRRIVRGRRLIARWRRLIARWRYIRRITHRRSSCLRTHIRRSRLLFCDRRTAVGAKSRPFRQTLPTMVTGHICSNLCRICVAVRCSSLRIPYRRTAISAKRRSFRQTLPTMITNHIFPILSCLLVEEQMQVFAAISVCLRKIPLCGDVGFLSCRYLLS